MRHARIIGVAVIPLLAGCVSSGGVQTRIDALAEAGEGLGPIERAESSSVELDGRFESYLAYAAEHSPRLRASFEAWRASVLRIDAADQLPDPSLHYAYFVRSVETRVGPQRHKVGASQMFPWPTRLEASTRVATTVADVRGVEFRSDVLEVRRRVGDVYWQRWAISRTRLVYEEQLNVLRSLVEAVRGRVEVGHASLADVGQLEIRISRLEDALLGLDEAAAGLDADLAAAVGAPAGTPTPVASPVPKPALPQLSTEDLQALSSEHPRVTRFAAMVATDEARAYAATTRRHPSVGIAVDWIETGDSAMPTPDRGKDPVIAMITLTAPIWWDDYAAEERAAQADARSKRASLVAAQDMAAAEVARASADIRDTSRQIHLVEDTLIPQALGVFDSVVGEFVAGRASIAELLLAHRDVLELHIQLIHAQAAHARAWTRLEHAVGRPVAAQETR